MNNISTRSNILKYLDCVKNLEVSVRKLSEAYQQVSWQVKQYEKESFCDEIELEKATINKKTPLITRISSGLICGVLGGVVALVIVAIIVVFKVVFIHEWALFDLILGRENYFEGQFSVCWVWFKIGGIVGFILGMWGAGPSRKEVKESNDKIIQQTKEYNEKIEMENAERRKAAYIARKKAQLYKNELVIIKKDYQKIKKLLDQYYELNYIYPKYRKLVYICSIYEYFDSGRCDTLTGPYGAYNLLEQDIKYSKIVERLDDISEKLDVVIENQQELYNALSDCKNSLNSLERSLDELGKDISNGFENLDEKLENVEFNSRIAAQSNQYIAMYHFFKN